MMETRQQVRQFLAENFLLSSDSFDMADDVSLLENGVVDSTGVLELISFVEETFGVQIRDEEIVPDNFDSVDRIVAYINDKTSAAVSVGE